MVIRYLCIFYIKQYNVGVHDMHAHSTLWTHICKPYPYELLRKTEPTDLEIHEVITCALQLTGTSPTTESIAPLNPGINPRKYEYPCQVEDLNLRGQVPPQSQVFMCFI